MHRKAPLLIAIVVVLGLGSFAMESVQAQTGSTVEGMVCSSWKEAPEGECYGEGIPDAAVTLTAENPGLLPASPHEATTDENGQFSMRDVADGDYAVSVERAGFEPFEGTATVADEATIIVSLTGTNVAQSGRVVDADGAGISDATITFSGNDYLRATSAADGTFTLQATAGHYWVQASHPDKATFQQSLLVDGEGTLTVSMKDAPERTARVAGQVTDQDGNPVADAVVQAWQYGGGCCYAYAEDTAESEPEPAPASEPYYYEDNYQEARTDDDGRYALNLYAGYVNLNAHKDGHANYWADFEVTDGEDREHDFVMEKYPPKTAKIEGRVVDAGTGDGVAYLSVSVESPRYGIYECSTSEASSGGDEPAIAPGEPYPDYESRCAITVNADGTFEGMVTPGYSIINVYHNHWQACTETQDSDGSYHRNCGPQYMAFSKTLNLEADDTTTINVELKQRPGPDATLSGYVIDAETQKVITNAQVSFSNQDTYGHAWAETDEDGSYKVRIRSGYHQVSVYAEGYFRWQGVIDVPADGDVALDIPLTAGQDRYGGCCYYYAHGDAEMTSSDEAHGARPADGGNTAAAGTEEAPRSSGSDDNAFQDLGGGLGPYDADSRAAYRGEAGSVKDTPTGLIVASMALLGAAFVARRYNR